MPSGLHTPHLASHRVQDREKAYKFPFPSSLPLLRTLQTLPSFLLRSTAGSGNVLRAEPQEHFATYKPSEPTNPSMYKS